MVLESTISNFSAKIQAERREGNSWPHPKSKSITINLSILANQGSTRLALTFFYSQLVLLRNWDFENWILPLSSLETIFHCLCLQFDIPFRNPYVVEKMSSGFISLTKLFWNRTKNYFFFNPESWDKTLIIWNRFVICFLTSFQFFVCLTSIYRPHSCFINVCFAFLMNNNR